jgi:hypothetical protein
MNKPIGQSDPEMLAVLRAGLAEPHPLASRLADAIKNIEDHPGQWEADDALPLLRACRNTLAAASFNRWLPIESAPEETPVLILKDGRVRIGELHWDHPGHEDTYKSYRYWDDPENDGQDWELSSITHWMPLPAPIATPDEE